MERDKILIIADSLSDAVQLSSMLPLTRFDDKISTIICQEVESFESACVPKLVILMTNNDNVLETLKQIKSSSILTHSKILLILEEVDNELLCSAYDIGIDNFMFSYDETSLFLTVISMLKSCIDLSRSEQSALMRDVLIDNEFMDSFLVYDWDKTKETLQSFLEERNFEYDVFVFSPPTEAKEAISKHILSATLVDSIRSEDIPVYLSDLRFCLLFKSVDAGRKEKFYEKLKGKFESVCHLMTVSATVGNNISNTVKFLEKMLDDNLKTGLEYAFYDKIEESEVAEDNSEEDYLKTKSRFWKNFSELTTPYFFRTKTIMESKFPDSEISDSVTEEETAFVIRQNNISGEIRITYPAFSRINASITFERNGESKTHKEFYETEDFSEQVLDELFSELFAGYEMLIHEDYNE
ncbi:hypothetical protein IKQ26_04645 [bacterium]|nr:hypothetical protein [bacterium]